MRGNRNSHLTSFVRFSTVPGLESPRAVRHWENLSYALAKGETTEVKGEDDEVEAILEDGDGDGAWEDAVGCWAPVTSRTYPTSSDRNSGGKNSFNFSL